MDLLPPTFDMTEPVSDLSRPGLVDMALPTDLTMAAWGSSCAATSDCRAATVPAHSDAVLFCAVAYGQSAGQCVGLVYQQSFGWWIVRSADGAELTCKAGTKDCPVLPLP